VDDDHACKTCEKKAVFMSNSQTAKNRARVRVALLLCICLGLIAVVLMEFPSNSTARQRSSQQQKKRTRPRFVPGEVLVRYRSESLAQSRTGRNVLAARTGEFLSVDVERRKGADLVPGLRLVHVAPQDTLAAVAALRSQPEVLSAEPNYIMQAAATPNDPHFLDSRQFERRRRRDRSRHRPHAPGFATEHVDQPGGNSGQWS
jgi:hypothetical protein